MSAYFRREDLEARVSAQTVREVYDDANTGTPDASAIGRLIADACSKVDSYLQPIYALPLAPTFAPEDVAQEFPIFPTEVTRLSLDVAVAMMAQRHPEYVRRDWERLMKGAEADLLSLRKSLTTLERPTAPEPGANQGATVTSSTGEPPESFFGNMGDF